jgi:hypothetical protein
MTSSRTATLIYIAARFRVKVNKNDPSGSCRFLVPKRSSRIVSAASNNDSSAQNRPRELKLMSLEPSGNEDYQYVFKIVLACLLTKRQCNTIFQSLLGGGRALWDKLAHRGSGNGNIFVNLMKMIDSSLPSVTHIWVTLSDFFTHFTLKRIPRMAFKKIPEVIIKLDKMFQDKLFFQIYII